MSRLDRFTPRAPMGLLVAAGSDGIGASVAAALLAMEAQADGARVLIVGPSLRAQRVAASLAAAFATLTLLLGRRPQMVTAVSPCGDADVTALHDAAERWLGRSLLVAPSLPIDPTLPVALGAGIPLAEAVADTALRLAAGALWSALSTSAPIGAYA